MIKNFLSRLYKPVSKIEAELNRILEFPRFQVATTNIFGKSFTFHDSLSFYVTYKEIFENEIYRFAPAGNKKTIIDCGANMGLSVAYFSSNYPSHTIYAFEPDPDLFLILEGNIKSLSLKNVVLYNKAVWDKADYLNFYTDGGMGGRLNVSYNQKFAVSIEAVPLKNYLTNDVDFLKIDIEGAEDVVLKSCAAQLRDVERIFFEYHNKINAPQTLHELLVLVKDAGFNYYVKESSTRKRPFVDTDLICETFDMAINIFCYK
ncbi:MAG: FkbM family methyltransferase [Bacteroidota bacterium]|nr:FkbM family methyltransferase [Bacteroidota bacterium]